MEVGINGGEKPNTIALPFMSFLLFPPLRNMLSTCCGSGTGLGMTLLSSAGCRPVGAADHCYSVLIAQEKSFRVRSADFEMLASDSEVLGTM